MIWTDQRHPDYEKIAKRSQYIDDHYTGEVLAKVHKAAQGIRDSFSVQRDKDGQLLVGSNTFGVIPYLTRRSQGEAEQQYKERAFISRYPRHFPHVVTTFTGRLMAVEADAEWAWEEDGKGLGDPMDDGSIMSGYWANADGKGTRWPQQVNTISECATTQHRVWYFIEPVTDKRARRGLIDQKHVVNWYEGQSGLEWVLLTEEIDDRPDPYEVVKDEKGPERYLLITKTGWERYEVSEENGEKKIERVQFETWKYPFYQEAKDYQSKPWKVDSSDPKEAQLIDPSIHRLPIAYKDLGLREHVGHRAAEDNNYLYNFLSDARMGFRLSNHARICPTTDAIDSETVENIAVGMVRGSSLLPIPMQYIAPPIENALGAMEAWKDEVRDFYVTNLSAYEDRAKEKTATEVKQDEQSGKSAFLALLSDLVDDVDNDSLFLISQIEFPEDPESWDIASVTRQKKFDAIDSQAEAERLLGVLFPLGFDLPPETAGKVAYNLTSRLKVGVDEGDRDLFEGMGEDKSLAKEQEEASDG